MEIFGASVAVARIYTAWQIYKKKVSSRVEIYSSDEDPANLHALAKDVLSKVPYRPAPYSLLDHHGQLQTAGQYFLRNLSRVLLMLMPHSHLYVHFERELVELVDGGVVAIDWASVKDTSRPMNEDPNRPIMILHHGLVGDSQSEYIYHFIRRLIHQGYRVGVMIARGCGGLPLRNVFTFAGRKTSDIRAVVQLVRSRYPQSKLFWMGYSLGAAATLQYLEDFHGESEEENSLLDAVMCVSPPWNFWVKERKLFDIWSMLMVVPLKMYLVKHMHVLSGIRKSVPLTWMKLFTIRDIFELNEMCYHGFGGLTRHGDAVLHNEENQRLLQQWEEEAGRFEAGSPVASSAGGAGTEGGLRSIRSIVSLQDLADYEQQQPQHLFENQLQEAKDEVRSRAVSMPVTSTCGSTDGETFEADSSNEAGLLETTTTAKPVPSKAFAEEKSKVTPEAIVSARNSDILTRRMENFLKSKHGTLQYQSVQEYYDDCSPVFRAHLITTPTLSISAKDDPICSHKDAPKRGKDIGPGLVVVKTKVGGHLAFPEDLLPLTHAWTDRVALEWFSRFQ